MNRENNSIPHRHDAVEAAACRHMFAAAPRDLASELGLEARQVAGATLLIAPGIPATMFNRVIGLGNVRAVTDADLDAIADVYRRAGVRKWWIHVTPGARPAGLAEQLAVRGFSAPARKSWAKMWRGGEAPQAVDSAVEVRLAQDSGKSVV